MASIAQAFRKQDPPDGPHFARVTPERQREALGLLLNGHASEHEPAVQPFLDYAGDQQLSLDELWVAQQGETLQAATLIVPCPGRSAMLFCSPATSWSDAAVVVDLLRVACEAQSPEAVRLIQCLLDPPHRRLAGALLEAGFWDLATLKYMQRRLDRRPAPTPLADRLPDYQVLSWQEANRDAFARAILATYEQTLDCPGLRGVRHIDDVIAGHQAAGDFRPDMWHAVYDRDQPVGVMLVNEIPQMEAAELVYLGLAVPYRGRGLGRQLIDHSLDLARAADHATMILAVDHRNEPAMRLYRGAGFRETATKRALVRTQ